MLSGYCAGWSLRTLLHEGLNGVPGKVEARPAEAHVERRRPDRQLPRHAAERVGRRAGVQLVRHLHGAVRPQGRADATSRSGSASRSSIYNLNVPSRWGTQTPFTNLTFDWVCPEDLREQVPVDRRRGDAVHVRRPAGRDGHDQPRLHRGDDRRATRRAACSRSRSRPTTSRRTSTGTARTPTALFAMTAQVRPAVLPELHQLGAEAEHDPLDVLPPAARPARAAQARQRPVRLGRADRVARRRDASTARGSGYLHARRRGGAARARSTRCSSSARDSLEVKRKVIQRYMDEGLFPYTKRYLGTLRNHFSTIGVNGINEMVRNFTGDATTSRRPRATRSRCACSTTCARAWSSSRRRPGTCTTSRRRRPRARPTASPRRTASGSPASCRPGTDGQPVLHELLAAAGRLHRRPVRGARAAGRAADASTRAARCCTCT